MGRKNTAPLPPGEHLLLHMQVLQAVLQEAEPGLTAAGLDPKGYFMLWLLDEVDSPAAIAKALVLPKPTATTIIKRAESAGYLTRETVPGDLRRFRLVITETGRAAREAGRQAIEAVFGERLGRLNEAERRGLEDALRKLRG